MGNSVDIQDMGVETNRSGPTSGIGSGVVEVPGRIQRHHVRGRLGAVALEGRSPFLDHEFLELTAQIPYDFKLKGRNNKKYILKEALRGIIPDEVMFRKKMGFGIPVHDWFRSELRDYAYQTLLSDKAISRGIFKKNSVKKLLDTHCTTGIDHGYRIWALITLELWFREYFD